MYWLLDDDAYEDVRSTIINLMQGLQPSARVQSDQAFVYNGRKDRTLAQTIIRGLSAPGDVICDPFGGSGVFAFAALDTGREVLWNEWEPYAFAMTTQAFEPIPSQDQIEVALAELDARVGDYLRSLYTTTCGECGRKVVFDRMFYDRDPLEYFNPTHHERMGSAGENIAFRRQYACQCGATQKKFDTADLAHMQWIDTLDDSAFPNPKLIENSRINLTAPEFTDFSSLFPRRSRLALVALFEAIDAITDPEVRAFLRRVAISIVANAKYVDYRNKTQDLHCPPVKVLEVNLYNQFLDKVSRWQEYFGAKAAFAGSGVNPSCRDFRDFLGALPQGSVDLLLTDPPYGDSEPYFEKAQRFHPFLGFNLAADPERLAKEVVVTDAPSRRALKNKDAFLQDLREFFVAASKCVKPMGYVAMYFRPSQSSWISDLNQMKLFAREAGFEPLATISLSVNDPSMRVLASTAWSFAKDVCFVFLRLPDEMRRWYESGQDVDELVYFAAKRASGDRAEAFVIETFYEEFRRVLRANDLLRLTAPQYEPAIKAALARFAVRDGAAYRLSGDSPYAAMNRDTDAELRAREYAPVVVEELGAGGDTFTFEQFVVSLATYLDNGSRRIIQQLDESQRLVPELLLAHAEPTEDGQAFRIRTGGNSLVQEGRTDLLSLSPYEFEDFVGMYFAARGFKNIHSIGGAGDRGVDLIATSADGELHFIQCKRYQPTNGIGSAPIQRVDSNRRSRNADHAWVVTTSYFTPQGISEARITGVTIVDGKALEASLEQLFPGSYYIRGVRS